MPKMSVQYFCCWVCLLGLSSWFNISPYSFTNRYSSCRRASSGMFFCGQVDTVKQGKSVSEVSTGACQMLTGSLQDFPSPSTSRRHPQKKEEPSIKVSTVDQSQHASRGSRSQSLCNPTLGKPHQTTVSTSSAPSHRSWSKHASRGSRKQLLSKPTLWQASPITVQRAQLQRREGRVEKNIMNRS